jgi:hypothetical protein
LKKNDDFFYSQIYFVFKASIIGLHDDLEPLNPPCRREDERQWGTIVKPSEMTRAAA